MNLHVPHNSTCSFQHQTRSCIHGGLGVDLTHASSLGTWQSLHGREGTEHTRASVPALGVLREDTEGE